jgi:glycine cleavage system pyridoxal-binding protein P
MLGRKGLREMGLQNLEAGAKLESTLAAAGCQKRFTGQFYNELVTTAHDPKGLHERALANGVHAGWDISQDVPALKNCLLWGSTPIHIAEDYQRLAKALQPNLKEVVQR